MEGKRGKAPKRYRLTLGKELLCAKNESLTTMSYREECVKHGVSSWKRILEKQYPMRLTNTRLNVKKILPFLAPLLNLEVRTGNE